MNFNRNFEDHSNQNNMNLNLDSLLTGSFNQQRMKLDEVLDSIKTIKQNYNIQEELKIAVKVLKRFKLNESRKWCSELLMSAQDINFNSSLINNNQNTCFKLDNNFTPIQNQEHNEGGNILHNKNLNNLFNNSANAKAEQFNFSSILLNSDRESITSHNNDTNNRTPDINTGNSIFNKMQIRLNFPKSDNKQIFESNNNNINLNLNQPNKNKYLQYFKHIKAEEDNIKDIISYADSLFELKEYLKCSFVLKHYAIPKYPTAMFIYYFAEFMIIQQKRQEELLDYSDLGGKYYSSKDINNLYQILSVYESNNQLGPFMLYLYGLILKEMKLNSEARAIFLKSLNQFPYLWSTWVELALIAKQNEMKIIFSEIEEHWMKFFYLANFLLEKNYEQESIIVCNNLLNVFPNSIFLLNTIAHSFYLIHEYETSTEYFEKLFVIDPNRYENMDTYSNILFIKENYCDLSNLAFKLYQNDKYRPETCCVIGNYYGLKADHAKAVVYFKRAIKLDYTFLPAWTLMGHEYLEMKIA